jgi:hypothetical protein
MIQPSLEGIASDEVNQVTSSSQPAGGQSGCWRRLARMNGSGAASPTALPPASRPLHVADPTDEGFRTIEVWESEQAWQFFRSAHLAPAIAAPHRPQPAFRDLYPGHLVGGDAIARARRPLAKEEQRSQDEGREIVTKFRQQRARDRGEPADA